MTPVFYAEGTQLPPRSTDIDEIIRDLRSRNLDYVITTIRGLRRNPYLKDLEGILLNSADFTRIYEDHRDPDHSISIFQYK